ncbi:MAG: chemotaxis protein CheD [Gemmatimonadota bacterium]|nr:MAG: chemotaxis protein CheD [Gemmatimonadota bacterium]
MTGADQRKIVGLGEYAVIDGSGTISALGLGSCVAVILHDTAGRVGAMAHVLLPAQSLTRGRNIPARAADTAVPLLVAQMRERGAVLERTHARLVGGSTMFGDLLPTGSVHIGERNVLACRTALRQAGVPIVAEAVGGRAGRSVIFDVGTGTVTVRVVGREPVEL